MDWFVRWLNNEIQKCLVPHVAGATQLNLILNQKRLRIYVPAITLS